LRGMRSLSIALECEVVEEIGFDIMDKISNDLSIIIEVDPSRTDQYYIIDGINIDTEFNPFAKDEIDPIGWFPLNDLPKSIMDCEKNKNLLNFVYGIPLTRIVKKWVKELENHEYDKKIALEYAIKGIDWENTPILNKKNWKLSSKTNLILKFLQKLI
jgi:hypothetical protein